MIFNAEMLLSIVSAVVVGSTLAFRLNILKLQRRELSPWNFVEVIGAVTGLAGCAGIVGHWFLENPDQIPADTVALVGLAVFAVGVSRGRVCEMVARIQGWNGKDRRVRW